MEPEGSLQHPQEPTAGPYSGLDQSSPYHLSYLSVLILPTHLFLSLPSGVYVYVCVCM
jgi:hypothetical protein